MLLFLAVSPIPPLLAIGVLRLHDWWQSSIDDSKGRCGECGYDLKGLAKSMPCPECGAARGSGPDGLNVNDLSPIWLYAAAALSTLPTLFTAWAIDSVDKAIGFIGACFLLIGVLVAGGAIHFVRNNIRPAWTMLLIVIPVSAMAVTQGVAYWLAFSRYHDSEAFYSFASAPVLALAAWCHAFWLTAAMVFVHRYFTRRRAGK